MNKHAVLEWRDGLPYSTDYQDIYFSVSADDPDHGLAETRHVFLQHNQLESRWKNNPVAHFTIVETGFGSGLNFLATLALWVQVASPIQHLHFFSIELAPFTALDLARAHQHFPVLKPFSEALLKQYQQLQPGHNQLDFPDSRVSLTLFIGDVLASLPRLCLTADAWFLDGFAPSKNPDMWQPALFQAMAKFSRPGATFSTFTCAGIVKRGLQEAGFVIEKTAGYGAKREMLKGYWPARDNTITQSTPSPLRIAVVGAGIAGASTAWHLAQLGCLVNVFERSEKAATGASGNPKGMLYPRLNAEKPLNDQLALRSYCYALRFYNNLCLDPENFTQAGLLLIGGSPRELKRVNKVDTRYQETGLLKRVTALEASQLAGVAIEHPSLYFPAGAWVNPIAACQQLLSHHSITQHYQSEVTQLSHQGSLWHLQVNNQDIDQYFDAVILCNAAEAHQLIPDSGMQLNPVRGQMGMIETNSALKPLQKILCGEGYLSPAIHEQHAMGATFAPGDTDIHPRESDNLANLEMVTSLSPQFAEAVHAKVTMARAALRCGSPDYLPYVGPIYPREALDRFISENISAYELPASQGLYAHVAHGSKGLMTAPYCAAILSRRLLQSLGHVVPQITEDTFWTGLHPQRHLFKQYGWRAFIAPAEGIMT